MRNIAITLVLIGWTAIAALSCRTIPKGYEALKEHNYFEAKKRFERGIKRQPSPSAFGLSMIYGRNNNPFSNMDSAYYYVNLAIETYDLLTDKKKLKYRREMAFSYARMRIWREEVSARFFDLAQEENTILGYMNFYAKHPWSPLRDSAIFLRDQLAYQHAIQLNTSVGYLFFLQHYPESVFVDEIQHELQLVQYDETIIEGDVSSFERFVDIYPHNFLIERAHRKIFELQTKEGTEQAYYDFIVSYPNNPYVNDAWVKMYRLATTDYTVASIQRFDRIYTDFPFRDLIAADLEMVGLTLFPFRINGLFGFMNENGLPLIPPMYDYAGVFSSGVAPVLKDDKFGFVDKNNKLVIDFRYDDALDFDEGRCIVENNGLLGLIDRTGKYILPTEFDDIGRFSEGLIYAGKDGKYGYFDKYGYNRIPMKYDEAFSFQNGLAKVIEGNTARIIDFDGVTVLSVKDADMRFFSDSVFVLETRDSVTLIHINGHTLLDFAVERIGSLVEDLALFELNGRYGYLNGKGAVIIEPQLPRYNNYFQFAQFKNGHAKFVKSGKFGLINTAGEQVIKPIFSDVGEFGELIPVTKGDKWGYADEAVKLKIPYRFDYAFGFENGRAKVMMNGMYGLINLNGDYVIEPEYDRMTNTASTFFIVEKDNLVGLVNTDGKLLVDLEYTRIAQLSQRYWQLESSYELAYFDAQEHRIIHLLKEDE
jgi:hypothetical protein